MHGSFSLVQSGVARGNGGRGWGTTRHFFPPHPPTPQSASALFEFQENANELERESTGRNGFDNFRI